MLSNALIILFFFSISIGSLQSQEKKDWKDSKLAKILKEESHSPQKATLFSSVLPGWGQAYNKKYWKVPIVWAGVGAVGYYIYDNQRKYNAHKDHYIYLSANPDSVIDSGNPARPWTASDGNTLLEYINQTRKNRDLSVIILFAVWGLNVIDANVDGHFFDFDIDTDLSMTVRPAAWTIGRKKHAVGFDLVFNLY